MWKTKREHPEKKYKKKKVGKGTTRRTLICRFVICYFCLVPAVFNLFRMEGEDGGEQMRTFVRQC